MEWNVVYISQEEALGFLRENHANREVIFIRPCDEWLAVYDNDELIGVTGVNRKKNHMSVDCSYVRKDYRQNGILKSFYDHILSKYYGDDFVIYCRPIAAHLVMKYYGFKSVQEFKNGTVKCILKRKKC